MGPALGCQSPAGPNLPTSPCTQEKTEALKERGVFRAFHQPLSCELCGLWVLTEACSVKPQLGNDRFHVKSGHLGGQG